MYQLFDFLQLDMTGCVIVSITIPTLTAGQKLTTFKIMPRHANAHAYVNAGFLMTVDSNQNGAWFCSHCISVLQTLTEVFSFMQCSVLRGSCSAALGHTA